MEKFLVKTKLITNFEENSKNINKEYNKKDFYKANSVKAKKNIYHMY